MDRLRMNEFTTPVSALSLFLDVTDDPSKANSIVKMLQFSREKALLDASKAAQASRFANGQTISSLLDSFRLFSETANPFAFDGTPVFGRPESDIETLKELSLELDSANEMNRHDLIENGARIGAQFIKNPSIQRLGKLLAIGRQTMSLVLKKKLFTVHCFGAAGLLFPLVH
jgi:hypothetical protein